MDDVVGSCWSDLIRMERGIGSEHGDAAMGQQSGQSSHHRLDHAQAIVAQRAEVDAIHRGVDAEFGRTVHGVDGVGGGDERLGGDAATVETGAAHGGVTLDECHFHAEFGGAQGCGIAAGAGPDDDQIKLFAHDCLLGAYKYGSHAREPYVAIAATSPKNSPLDCFLYGSAPQRGEPEYIWTISPPASDRASGNAAWEASNDASESNGSKRRRRSGSPWTRTVRRTWR